MIDCDEALAKFLLQGARDGEAAAHVAGCPRCAPELTAVEAARRALAAGPAPMPPADLATRVCRAAAPLLARNARRAAWPLLSRALVAALLPLPVILLFDVYLVRTAFGLLTSILPTALGAYLVFNYAATLALLLALTYGAIPILVEQQVRRRVWESHA
jgi:anti-sigma factor RsiW